MASFAKLNDRNSVIEVLAISNDVVNNLPFPESEPLGVSFLNQTFDGYSNWKQTSYNSNFRKNFAGIGYTYSVELDAFVPPKPYPSWLLDTNTAQWVPPIPYPTDGNLYQWDESTKSWLQVTGA